MKFNKINYSILLVISIAMYSCGGGKSAQAMKELNEIVNTFNEAIDGYCACLEKEKSKSKCRNFSLSFEVTLEQEIYDALPQEGHDLIDKTMTEGPQRIKECGEGYDY